MALSRQSLGFLTLVIIVGGMAAGMYFRLKSNADETETDASTEAGTVLPESASQQFATDVPQPVVGAEVVRDTLWITVSAAGQAEAFRRTALLSRVGGIIDKVWVQENQAVPMGGALLQVDTTEYALALARATADHVSSEARYQEMVFFDDEITDPAVREERARLSRARSGLAQAAVSLQEATLNLRQTSVTAPFPGRIADLRVVEGQYVSPGAELLTVVDLDPIKVEVQVLEAEIGYLTEGRRATVTFAAFPGETFTGRVATINPVVDPEFRTGRVTVLLSNPRGRIKPGMYARVSLEAQYFPDRILVPRSAILEKDRRDMLFVFEDGRAKWRYVTRGLESDRLVEIVPNEETSMVEPGEIVLIDNHFYIQHDAQVQLVEAIPADLWEGPMKGGRRARALGTGLHITLLIPGLVFFPASGSSQESQTISLEEAVQRASEFNPALRRIVNNLELSEVERKQAWGAYLPTLSVSSSTGVNLNRQLISFDEFGNPVQNPVTEWRTSSSTSQSINASLSIYQWGARKRDMETQRAVARSREAAVTAQSRGLRAEVVRAYRNAQNQDALLAVEASLLESRQLDLETTRRMFELAGATRVDVLTAELQVQQQEQRIREAEGQLNQALLSLRTVVGDPDLNDFRVSAVLPEAFDPSGLDPVTLGERAFASNPNLIEQEAAVDVSIAQAQSAKRAHWPPLTISFSARQSSLGDNYGGFAEPWPDRSRSGSAGFGITIPILQGFDNTARIVQAEVARVNQEETLRESRLRVEEAVQSRLIALETAHQSYLITVRSQEIAQERLRLGREQFRLGSRTFTELQQDIDAASQAERAVINQLFALEQALANLEEMVGEELR